MRIGIGLLLAGLGLLLARFVTMAPLPEPDPLPTYPRLELHEIFDLVDRQDEIPWKPFQDGVEIHRLYGDGVAGPTAALIRFRKAGKVPRHLHAGYEHIIVLAGGQRDQNGVAKAGTLMINPPGSEHSVVSEAGCIVLAIYEKPVQFLREAPRP
jgi:anti-sigma factor ChrR (cupin superfamily)